MGISAVGHNKPINDIEMYYEIRGEGEPLVLLHGWTGVGSNWEMVFKQPPEGYKLIIPDLRGHGRSTNPSKTFTFKQCCLDVFALLDSLSIKHFSAIGVSLGAKTLLHMATSQLSRVKAMVLVSAAPYFPRQARLIMGQMTPENRSEEEWKQMRQWHKQGDEQIVELWRQGNAFKDSYEDMNFTSAYLSTIKASTLIVHGDRDPLYPISMALELHNSISGSHLWIIPNGGHGPIFGEYTGNGETTSHFAEVSLAFLRDQRVRTT